jgi:hypothetical protein
MEWRDSYHVTCFQCSLRYTTVELCFLCLVRAERIWENTGMGIDFTWVPKFQGNSSVVRRRIRRLSVWRYMCYSYSNLESVRTNLSIQTSVLVTPTRDSINKNVYDYLFIFLFCINFLTLSHTLTWFGIMVEDRPVKVIGTLKTAWDRVQGNIFPIPSCTRRVYWDRGSSGIVTTGISSQQWDHCWYVCSTN